MKREDLELIDYSIYFATKAHAGQKRKSEPDLDMIFHPFTVGMILQRAGANTNCVIAGILHDVVEDTKYTLEDIKNEFGPGIAKIVDEVSEDKSLKWKERKIEAINKIKTDNYQGYLKEFIMDFADRMTSDVRDIIQERIAEKQVDDEIEK